MTGRSDRVRADFTGPAVGGLITALALFGGVIGVGRIGDFEALRIIEAVLPTTRFLASTAIAASVTVLALLLTLIGLSLTSDMTFHPRLYKRARIITILSVAVLVLATALLLAVTMPIGEVENLSRFYDWAYYVLAAVTAVLGGMTVTIGLMISATLLGLIELAHPEGSNDLLHEVDPEPGPS